MVTDPSETTPNTDDPTTHGQPMPRRPRCDRLLAAGAWAIVVTSYTAVAFAFAFPHDFGNSAPAYVSAAWTAFMIRTFMFHLGLLLCVVALGAAVRRRWRLLIATLPILLLCLGPALRSYIPKPTPPIVGEPIKVMGVNVLGANRNTDAIIAEVTEARPDLLLVQEYRSRWHAAFQQELADDYPHWACTIREDNFGLAIYSRFPFVESTNMEIPLGSASTPQARAVISVGERPVAVYVVHLMPPRSRPQTIEQRREFADLLEQLEREALPIILCGDFNFTNRSVFADRLRRLGLVDAHLISGWGRGSTWPAIGFFRYLPGLRIDHLFLSKELTSTQSHTGIGTGSDHRPIIAEIGFAE